MLGKISNTFLLAFMTTLSLLLTNEAQGQPFCEPDCFCVPENNADSCPDIGVRQSVVEYAIDGTVPEFWSDPDIKLIGKSPALDPAGCQPFPAVAAATGQPICTGLAPTKWLDKLEKKDDPGLCVFIIKNKKKKNKWNLCSKGSPNKPREYKLQTVPTTKDLKKDKKKKYIVTHEGHCGVCSNGPDLAANLNPNFDALSFQCAVSVDPTIGLPASLVAVQECFMNVVGLTEQCAYVFASNAVNTLLFGTDAVPQPLPDCVTCVQTCATDFTSPGCQAIISQANDPTTCALNACLQCDKDASGQTSTFYTGRTRRKSGILSTFFSEQAGAWVGLKRECDSLANLEQIDPC